MTTKVTGTSEICCQVPSSAREQHRMVLSNIAGLISCERLSAPGKGLDVLCFAESGLHDCLKLMILYLVLANDWGKPRLRMVEVGRLQERVRAAEEDSRALCVARACIDELTAAHTSLIVGIGQAKAECDTLAVRICELGVTAATCDEELGVMLQFVRYLKGHVPPGEHMKSTAQAMICKTQERCPSFVNLSNG